MKANIDRVGQPYEHMGARQAIGCGHWWVWSETLIGRIDQELRRGDISGSRGGAAADRNKGMLQG